MAATTLATFGADGSDPRLDPDAGNIDVNGSTGFPGAYITPQQRLLHDPAVTFEEYYYYANRTRAEELQLKSEETGHTGIRQILFPPKSAPKEKYVPGAETTDEKGGVRSMSVADGNLNLSDRNERIRISDEEWTNASRSFRTASWAACFYLITTDILGPFGVG